MKLSRLILVVAFMALTCSLAYADGATDPVFKIGTGSNSEVLTSDSFSFSLAKGTTGAVTFDFINFTGALISELDLSAPAGFTYSCQLTVNPYFNNCSPQVTTTGDATLIRFFGLDADHLGIPTANHINGDCDNDGEFDSDDSCTPDVALSDFTVTVDVGSTPLSSSLTVQGTLIPAPEPSTLILVLAAGLGFLAVKRFGVAS